jgi:hypothetical protein
VTDLVTLVVRLFFPWAPAWLVNVLSGFSSGLAEGFARERNRRKADVDKGAQDQREAQEQADERLAEEARALRRAVDSLDDEHARAGLREWMRKSPESGGPSRG